MLFDKSHSNKTIQEWRCPNCGQHLFTALDEEPPDDCDYCDDMTTWQRVEDDDDKASPPADDNC